MIHQYSTFVNKVGEGFFCSRSKDHPATDFVQALFIQNVSASPCKEQPRRNVTDRPKRNSIKEEETFIAIA